MLLLNSAHHHAQMSRFDHNAHALGSDCTVNRISDLRCESLLYLQSTSKDVHQARNFAESNYFSIRDIRDVDLAEERQKVVFAQTEHLNILDDHHLVVSYVEHRAQQNLLRVLLVALGQILHRSFHTFGSIQESITLWGSSPRRTSISLMRSCRLVPAND